MKQRYILAGFVFCAALASPTIAQAETVVVEPSSQWNVDYGKETCRLARTFGPEDNRHAIFFEQWGPDTAFNFTAAGPGFKRFRSGKTTYWQLFDDHEAKKTEPFKGDLGSIGPAIIYSSLSLEEGQSVLYSDARRRPLRAENDAKEQAETVGKSVLPQIDTEFAAKIEYISLRQGKRTIVLKTGALDDAFKVLNDCTAGLITEWGLDRARHANMSKRPVWTNQLSIVRRIGANYPRKALLKGEQGIMQMRVNIDETGTVTDCTIGKATDTDYLESPACGPMQGAQFEPALDQDGQPMASFYRTSITYRTN